MIDKMKNRKEHESMKLTNTANIDKFFEVVDKCEGRVEMLTENGDCLDLRPKLCQFVTLVKMLADGNVEQMEIIAENKKDEQKLMAYMINC